MTLTVADPNRSSAAPAPGSEPPRAVASGVAWTTVGQFGVQAINFAAQLGLTLFIAPAEFGLVAVLNHSSSAAAPSFHFSSCM